MQANFVGFLNNWAKQIRLLGIPCQRQRNSVSTNWNKKNSNSVYKNVNSVHQHENSNSLAEFCMFLSSI
jgi:hypothetical protein